MHTLWQDLRYGLRVLLKQPGFTLIAVITLALGIGANTAIFSVVNAVVLRPLPYRDPDRLVMVWENNLKQGRTQMAVSLPTFADWSKQNQVFAGMAGYITNLFNLQGVGDPEQLRGAVVSTEFFSVLGVSPLLGRAFLPSDDRERVAIISHRLWLRRFGADPGVIGRAIVLHNESYTVAGVMPSGFQFPPVSGTARADSEIWTTLALLPQSWRESRSTRGFRVFARLRDGVSFEQAQTEMQTIARRFEQDYPNSHAGVGVTLVSLHEQVVGNVRLALLTLLAAVGFVLLIACANVANLLLVRTATREREIAIRTALGAGRTRLLRQLLTESLLLAALGGVAGLLLAVWGVNTLVSLGPSTIPRLDAISLDRQALAFTLGVSLLTGVIFGLAPALQASKLNLNEALKEGGKGSGGRGHRLRSLLVVSEIALAVVLLVGAGLMARSFWRLINVNPGFGGENVLTMFVGIAGAKYPQGPQQIAFFRQALERIEALPGVQAVGGSISLPPSIAQRGTSFTVEGHPAPGPGQSPLANFLPATTNYFRALNVPLLRGRSFTEQDKDGAPGVAIINETMARRFFANEDPIGKRLKLGGPESSSPWLSVVGVVGDVKYRGLAAESEAGLYVPYLQAPYPWLYLVVRTAADPLSVAPGVRREIWAIDKEVPIADLKPMNELLSESVAQPRFSTLLLGLFAAVALVLAMVGIYGVMAYSVAQRTHEIGIRLALGAQTQDVLRLVVGQGLKLVLVGVGIGLLASWGMTRLLSTLLYGVSATDPLTFSSVALLLTVVALAACYLPARRATRVDPIVALRYE